MVSSSLVNQIDTTQSIEKQARQAVDLRNKYCLFSWVRKGIDDNKSGNLVSFTRKVTPISPLGASK